MRLRQSGDLKDVKEARVTVIRVRAIPWTLQPIKSIADKPMVACNEGAIAENSNLIPVLFQSSIEHFPAKIGSNYILNISNNIGPCTDLLYRSYSDQTLSRVWFTPVLLTKVQNIESRGL